MNLITVVFGERADLVRLALQGALWVEDLPGNRAQVEPLWKSGSVATLFQTKDVFAVLTDADLHEPDWHELRVLRG